MATVNKFSGSSRKTTSNSHVTQQFYFLNIYPKELKAETQIILVIAVLANVYEHSS
jgi:transposase